MTRLNSPGKKTILVCLVLCLLAFAGGSRYGAFLAGNDRDEAAPTEVAVYVTGAVADPAVYQLPADARVEDAVALASPRKDADLEKLNLAAHVTDGQEIRVPSVYDTEETEAGAVNSGGMLDLNAATPEQLEALPGIGEVKADAIVEYRNTNGDFTSLDQLLNVSGIGSATLENLREHLYVD